MFSLTYCRSTDVSTSVTYSGSYSATNPLPTSGGTTIDPKTGTVCFTPSALAVGVICIRVEEYRNGVKIGEYERDMQVRVVSCNNQLPTASGINGVPYDPNNPPTYTVEVCATGAPTCFTINFSDPDGGQNLTVSWNNGIPGASFTVSNNGTPTPTATFCWTPTPADIGQHQFVVTVMDNACPIRGVNSYGYVVNVIGGVAHPVDAGPDATICQGQSVTLSGNVAGPPGDIQSVQWTPATGLSNPNILNPVASPTSTTTYTLEVTFVGGCRRRDQVTVTVLPLPAPPTVTPLSPQVCSGSSVLLTASSPGAVDYEWREGTPSGPIVGMGANFTASPAATTTYYVFAIGSNGCRSAPTPVTVSVNPPPLVHTYSVTDVSCNGGSDGAVVVSVSGGTPGYQYSIDGGVTWVGGSGGSYTFSGLSAGSYVVEVRDGNGCVGSVGVVVGEPSPLVLGIQSVTSAICRESADGAAVVGASGGTLPYSYSWVGVGSGAAQAGLSPGLYTVIVEDANGCRDTVEVEIPYRSYVDVEIVPDSVAGCVPFGVRWRAEVAGVGPYSYEWAMGDGGSSADSVVDWVYTSEGIYNVVLIVRNGDGCADTARGVAEAYFTPVPAYVAEPDIRDEFVMGTVVTLTSTTEGATLTRWVMPGYGSHEGEGWQVQLRDTGQYCFRLIVGRGGCVDSVEGCIRIRAPYIYIPNAFTPNGDGVNDYFEVRVWGLREGRLRIWDRWGVLVFDNGGDMTRYWDGTYRGQLAPEDAYTFVIEGKLPPDDKPIRRSGTVTLVR